MAAVLPSTFTPPTKRKFDNDTSLEKTRKKTRVARSTPSGTSGLPLEPHEALFAELRPKYDVATFSVISSTSIQKRIDQILAQLARFHPVDLSVLPGVVLMHARSGDAAKMVSVIELARRQINEQGHKWYQYNRLYEVENNEMPESDTVIEETVLPSARSSQRGKSQGSKGEGRAHNTNGAKEDHDEDDHDDDGTGDARDDYCFEAASTVFERAVLGRPKPQHSLYMSIFLSRVPIPELGSKSFITCQTNAALIDARWRREFGS